MGPRLVLSCAGCLVPDQGQLTGRRPLKLYDGPAGRQNPRRVRVFLAEKSIEVRDSAGRHGARWDTKSDEVTALNPLQRLPVLVLDDGTVIAESVAICRYFEELHPEPPLMGTDARDRAIVEMWNRRMELHYLAAVAAAFRHTHPAMKEWEVPQLPEWGEANRPKCWLPSRCSTVEPRRPRIHCR